MSAEPYKIEILEDILTKDPAAPITVYHVGAPVFSLGTLAAPCIHSQVRSHIAAEVDMWCLWQARRAAKATGGICALDRMWSRQGRSTQQPSAWTASPAHTGAAMRPRRSCSGYMGRRGKRRIS